MSYKRFVIMLSVVGISTSVWAETATCHSARDCVCIAESKPVCKHADGNNLGICSCIPQQIPAV